jgi:hypothetical protein
VRFGDERLAGLFSRHAGQEPSTLTPELEACILEWTVKRKPTASTHWSTRKSRRETGGLAHDDRPSVAQAQP